jgi:hypothetical protein
MYAVQIRPSSGLAPAVRGLEKSGSPAEEISNEIGL